MRQIVALHPHPEPPYLDAFLTPYTRELNAFGPLTRQTTESSEVYLARTKERSTKLELDVVKYAETPAGDIDYTAVVTTRQVVMLFQGPITSDTPMRARAAQRGYTAHTFGAMCCHFQVIVMPG